LSDAEIAATERAEAQREAARAKQATAPADAAADALPQPVDSADAATASTPKPVATAAAPADTKTTTPTKSSDKPAAATTRTATAPTLDDNTRYLLQAGAFQASGQAEELKARIALLGLGARVEAADIKGTTVYRVRMGPYDTATDLAEAKRMLSAGGLPAVGVRV
jgi:cell division protein FtsN